MLADSQPPSGPNPRAGIVDESDSGGLDAPETITAEYLIERVLRHAAEPLPPPGLVRPVPDIEFTFRGEKIS